jgi:hypothetical protein
MTALPLGCDQAVCGSDVVNPEMRSLWNPECDRSDRELALDR